MKAVKHQCNNAFFLLDLYQDRLCLSDREGRPDFRGSRELSSPRRSGSCRSRTPHRIRKRTDRIARESPTLEDLNTIIKH